MHSALCRQNSSGEYDKIHLDDKWFNIIPTKERICLSAEEKAECKHPKRKVRWKGHAPKVMFLAVTACPRCNENGNCTFDGNDQHVAFCGRDASTMFFKEQAPRHTWAALCVSDKGTILQLCLDKSPTCSNSKWPRDCTAHQQQMAPQMGNPIAHFKETDQPGWKLPTVIHDSSSTWRNNLCSLLMQTCLTQGSLKACGQCVSSQASKQHSGTCWQCIAGMWELQCWQAQPNLAVTSSLHCVRAKSDILYH